MDSTFDKKQVFQVSSGYLWQCLRNEQQQKKTKDGADNLALIIPQPLSYKRQAKIASLT